MVILSVDYGDARTGVAVCDKMEILASPVGVIHESYEPKVIAKLKEIVAEKKPELIVVGLPVNMDGTKGERAEKCTLFAERLSEELEIEVKLYDERLTTVSAHRILSENNVRGQKRKKVVDAVSAVMILEAFLKTR